MLQSPALRKTDRLAFRLLPDDRRALEELATERGERISDTTRALIAYALRAEKRRRYRQNRLPAESLAMAS